MAYTFDYGAIVPYTPLIAKGVGITVELTVVGGVLGVLFGIVCAWARSLGPKWLRPPVVLYVELIRNTPFLI